MSRKLWIVLFLALAVGCWWWLRQGASVVRNAPPGRGPIVAFGDSLTAGYGAPPGAAYPDNLARLIGRPVINRGVPGNTIDEAYTRLANDVFPLKPSIVIVLLGGNDYLRQKNLESSFMSLEKTVRELQSAGAMVVLVGLDGFFPFSGYDNRFEAIAQKTSALYVPHILRGIIGNRKLMSDQVHPNADGYALIAERIASALQPYLKNQMHG